MHNVPNILLDEEPTFICCSEDLALWSDWEKEGTWGTEVVLLIALALFKFAKASKRKFKKIMSCFEV